MGASAMAPGYFDGAVPAAESSNDLGFTVVMQRVFLTVDFASRSITGTTDITITPTTKNLKHIRLNCRQARVISARVGTKNAVVSHVDPYERLKPRGKTTVHQHQMLRSKIEPYIKDPPEPELSIAVPPKIRIEEAQPDAQLSRTVLERHESEYGAQGPDTPQTAHAQDVPKFNPLNVSIEFKVDNFRHGLHFVGVEPGDNRFPHLYTTNSIAPGSTSSIFPCVDDPNTRCMWEVSIRCPKTLGDAFRKPKQLDDIPVLPDGDIPMTGTCLLYTSPSPRDGLLSRMPSSA